MMSSSGLKRVHSVGAAHTIQGAEDYRRALIVRLVCHDAYARAGGVGFPGTFELRTIQFRAVALKNLQSDIIRAVCQIIRRFFEDGAPLFPVRFLARHHFPIR